MVWTPQTRLQVGDLGLGAALNDEQYALIARFLPERKTRGRPRFVDRRRAIEGILYVLRVGCQWRMLPSVYPPWQTTYGFFRDWTRQGVWDKAMKALRESRPVLLPASKPNPPPPSSTAKP